MTIPDPPWKQKTRPCPFYSQGRCLFSDSCNFLHDVKVKAKQPEIAITSPTQDVTISFTQSSPVATNTPPDAQLGFCSPPRSPRLSSLLLALGDVIGPDDEVQLSENLEENNVSDEHVPTPFVSGVTASPELTESGANVQDECMDDASTYCDNHGELSDSVIAGEPEETAGVVNEQSAPNEPIAQAEPNALLSPLEVNLAPPLCWPLGQLEAALHREDSVDSGYGDAWTGPTPFSLSPPRRENTKRYSTLSLISSPFGSPARALSPKFGPSAGSAWPASPLFSPAKPQPSSRPTSLHLTHLSDDLDSPTDYNHTQQFDSPVDTRAELDEDTTVQPAIPVTVQDLNVVAAETEAEFEEAPVPPTVMPEKKQLHICIPSTCGSPVERRRTPPKLSPVAHEISTGPLDIPADVSTEQPDDTDSTALYNNDYPKTLFAASPRQANLQVYTPISSSASSDQPILPAVSLLTADTRNSPVSSSTSTYAFPEFVAGSSKDASSPAHSRHPSRTVSPSPSLKSPLPQPPGPPSTLSCQSSISETLVRPFSLPRKSTKVPFGFRHSAAARSRESLTTRPGSAPPTRHRSPTYVGSTSARSNSLNDCRSDPISEELPVSSSKLRPLRLSILVNSSSATTLSNSSVPAAAPASLYTDTSQPLSPSVRSDYSLSNYPLLSSSRSDFIPNRIRNSIISPTAQSLDDAYQTQSLPTSATDNHSLWNNSSSVPSPSVLHRRVSQVARPGSRLSERVIEDSIHEVDEPPLDVNHTVTDRAMEIYSAPPFIRPPSFASSVPEAVHAIATPKPTLLFAIASDDVNEVRRVLQSGEASPNDDVGPQSALAFTLASSQLTNKTEIVKLLLAHGADPSSLQTIEVPAVLSPAASPGRIDANTPRRRPRGILESADPATRYYISRAEAPQTRRASALIHRSFFRPLTKVRYEMVGQDRALEQLFRVLSMPNMAPIVVLLCGPSGHGKSLLARRFGFLLDVPTHTVNMTTLRSTHDIWRSYSMSPYEEPSSCTLADFLMENEGKRCVVVLDEIEKTENDKVLSSLLMPWELGRCSFEAGHRHVNVSKVIWLGTSNIGHDLVFEHQLSRASPEDSMTRDEYVDLMTTLRPIVSERLGPSLLSRVTTVLPFVPFTTDEKLAIATEALYALVENAASQLPSATVEKVVRDSLQSYVPAEGARSLYRAVSTQLLETM